MSNMYKQGKLESMKKPPLPGLTRSDTNKSIQMLTSLSNSFNIEASQPR